MLTASWIKHRLEFKFLAKTSREAMRTKDTYYVRIADDSCPGLCGIGECNLFRGLSAESGDDYEQLLDIACQNPAEYRKLNCSSINFGFETALADLANHGCRTPFPSDWSQGKTEIKINGLIWMGDKDTMRRRIAEKLDAGFRCLKLKIGGIRMDEELELLKSIRSTFGPDSLELRLDANGAFDAANALSRIESLSRFHVHSLEQPIKAGQLSEMARICSQSPIDIALDEELIGVRTTAEKAELLQAINPRYIIVKPALCGGFEHADEWIRLAQSKGIGWWATSALESNIGLNAIAQWVSQKSPALPQGLGTGALYSNNVASPIVQERDIIRLDPTKEWNYDILRFQGGMV